MILITLSMFLAVVIIQTHIRGDRKNKVPPWLRRVRHRAFSLQIYLQFLYICFSHVLVTFSFETSQL